MEISFLQWGFASVGVLTAGSWSLRPVHRELPHVTVLIVLIQVWAPSGSVRRKKQPVKNDIAWNPQTIFPGLFPKFASKGVTPAEVCQPNKFRS